MSKEEMAGARVNSDSKVIMSQVSVGEKTSEIAIASFKVYNNLGRKYNLKLVIM